jgi:hypothetical protein
MRTPCLFPENSYTFYMLRLIGIVTGLAGLAVAAFMGCVAFAFVKSFGFNLIALSALALCVYAGFKCLRLIASGDF